MNIKKAAKDSYLTFTFLTCLLLCIFSLCTIVYKPTIKPDVNSAEQKSVTIDSLINDPEKYKAYESTFSDLLKDKYFEANTIARQEYIKVFSKAEELGIRNSPYLDSCCNHIRKIDSLLNGITSVKYCDTVQNGLKMKK